MKKWNSNDLEYFLGMAMMGVISSMVLGVFCYDIYFNYIK